MGIEGFIGRPGAGKTYNMVACALKEANKGRPVYANFFIDHPNAWIFAAEDLIHLPPGVVCIDEAHLWFSARNSLNLPPSWLHKLSQTRKAGWDLYWTAQHESRVDRVVRDVTTTMWLTKAYFGGFFGHPLFFTMDGYEPEYFRQTGKRYFRKINWWNDRISERYDTLETVSVASHFHRKNDVYRSA